MFALLQIYAVAVGAGVIMAPTLSLLGAQLAARDKAMQTLCVGQGATLGVLLGLGTLKILDAPDLAIHLGPFVTAVLCSIGTYLFSDRITKKHQSSKNTFFTAIFATLLGSGYLVCAIFPPLENHMTQVFFGDLATLSNWESVLAMVIGIVSMMILTLWWRSISYESFRLAVFGGSHKKGKSRVSVGFEILAILLLSFSVQFLGFLFTISALFLPTVLAKLSANRHLKQHLISIALLSSVASAVGFVLSLQYSRLPTVPMILLVMVGLGILTLGVEKIIRAKT